MDCSKNITPEHTGKAGRYILGIPSFGPNLLSGHVPENVVWSLTHSQHWDMVQGWLSHQQGSGFLRAQRIVRALTIVLGR